MPPGRPGFRWAAKLRVSAAFCLAGAVAGTGLYFGNLAYVPAGDEAARAAAAARQAAAPLQAPHVPKPENERQAATDMAALLSVSISDRTAIVQASQDAGNCGSSLAADQVTFQQAASGRRSLVKELASIGLERYLPTAMLSDLNRAWQASMQADLDYAKWAADESSHGCTTNDPWYAATDTPNQTATIYKQAFMVLWNPIAQQYGLPTYDQGQL